MGSSAGILGTGSELPEKVVTNADLEKLVDTSDQWITDRTGIAIRHAVGIDNMMWSSDYPHHGNDWPYSRKTIEDMMGHIPRDERARIVGGNAARIFRLAE